MSDVEGVKERVQTYLTSVGTVAIRGEEFVVDAGSTRVFVAVTEHGNKEATIVEVYAPVLFEVPLTAELYRHMAIHSSDWVFGHTTLMEVEGKNTGMIFMKHTLLGDYLDKDELLYAVFGIGSSADEADDALQSRFGGQRLADL